MISFTSRLKVPSLKALCVGMVAAAALLVPTAAHADQPQPIRPAPFATPATVHGHTPAVKRMINAASRRYRVPAGVIAGIAKVETNFDSTASTPARAQGLMSLMPQTALALGVRDTSDPWQSIAGASKLLSVNLEFYDGNVRRAVAAYYAGTANVPQTGPLPALAGTPRYVARVLQAGRALGYSTTTVTLS